MGEIAVQTIRKFLHNQASFKEFLDAIRDIEYCYVHPEVRNFAYTLRLITHNESTVSDKSYALECLGQIEKYISERS